MGASVAFARPRIADWVRDAFAAGLTLHEAASRDPEALPMKGGRGTVYIVDAGGTRCAVRRYQRGGGMRFLGDRYLRLGSTRPQQEAVASEEAERRGVRTARVLAWAVYPAGAFYRADLVTEFVPATVTLAALLLEQQASTADRAAGLRSAGSLIASLATAGLQHADLNANNILLQRSPEGFEPIALDLDRMVVGTRDTALDPAKMLARLVRSLRKMDHQNAMKLSAAEWGLLKSSTGTTG